MFIRMLVRGRLGLRTRGDGMRVRVRVCDDYDVYDVRYTGWMIDVGKATQREVR
jgi:hypothetical protein